MCVACNNATKLMLILDVKHYSFVCLIVRRPTKCINLGHCEVIGDNPVIDLLRSV